METEDQALSPEQQFSLERLRKERENRDSSRVYYQKHFFEPLRKIMEKFPDLGYKRFYFPRDKIHKLEKLKWGEITCLVLVITTNDFDPFGSFQQHLTLGSTPEPNPNPFHYFAPPERLVLMMTRRVDFSKQPETVICERTDNNEFTFSSNVLNREPVWFHVPPPLAVGVKLSIDRDNIKSYANRFDVILADPPWQIGSSDATRGVSIKYNTMSLKHILELEIPNLLESGYVFIWVTTLSFFPVINQFSSMGFELVEEIIWLKYSKKSKLYQSTGNWWLRAKESCLMFKKNCFSPLSTKGENDILACLRRAPSQKPDELYELIEQLVPKGRYLELFARKNNLRNNWTSIGDQALI